jgi:hypothetical protein
VHYSRAVQDPAELSPTAERLSKVADRYSDLRCWQKHVSPRRSRLWIKGTSAN